MDCETCNDLLMDLLYEELDDVRAAAARKHIDACPACRSSWQRVSQGRALASTLAPVTAPLPSAALLAAIEAAAKQNAPPERASVPAEPRAAGTDSGVAPVTPLDHAPRRLPTWLHRLGDLAMRRQVAMAAVVLLSVGVVWKFVPSHTPSSIGTAVEGNAPEVIPATELPSESPTATATPSASAPVARSRAVFRGSAQPADHRAAAARPAAPRAVAPTPSTELDPVASNAVRMQETGSLATGSGTNYGSAPSANAAYRAQPASADSVGLNAPSGLAAADRDLGRALPPAPIARQAQQSNSVWRSSWNAAEDQRAHGDTEAAIASYRAALDADPPESERTRIATALIGQLSRAGRVAEVEVVRARYLRPVRDSAAQVDEAQAPSVPHTSTSVPHPSMQRPARRAMPAATNIQAY